MTDSLQDILRKRDYGEPPEIARVRSYCEELLSLTPRVAIRSNTIFVTVPSAAAAGTLRVHIFKLERELGNRFRIAIRIG